MSRERKDTIHYGKNTGDFVRTSPFQCYYSAIVYSKEEFEYKVMGVSIIDRIVLGKEDWRPRTFQTYLLKLLHYL